MEQLVNIEIRACEGITTEVTEEPGGKIVISIQRETSNIYFQLPSISAGEYAKVLSVYTDSAGNKAVIPPGWTVSGVPKENIIWGKDKSLVIYRIPEQEVIDIDWLDSEVLEKLKRTYNQIVWIPVSLLEANATFDGEHFSEKFGRRNYMNDIESDDVFNKALGIETLQQLKRVKKYGGYYISRYNISSLTEKPKSIKGVMPLVNINLYNAKNIASSFEYGETVESHLTFGAEYDSVLEWFIETKAKTFREIAQDSTECGNHVNTKNSPCRLVETGSREEWCINNVYDFIGNVCEWTQERDKDSNYILRGGCYSCYGRDFPVAYRFKKIPYFGYCFAGLRAALYIK